MNSAIEDVFRYCPVCGAESDKNGQIPFICLSCEYHHFFSPATAVGALIPDSQGRLLLIERARDPGKGLLGMPGGFIDVGETAEVAVKREVKAEVGLEITKLKYLMTSPNVYVYRGIETKVLDLFIVCTVKSLEAIEIEKNEVSGVQFVVPSPVVNKKMAFESNRKAVQRFVECCR